MSLLFANDVQAAENEGACVCVCKQKRSWLSEQCAHPSEVWISLSIITLQVKSTKYSEGTGWGKASAEIWRRMKEKAMNRHTKLRWRPTWPTMWPQWDGKKKKWVNWLEICTTFTVSGTQTCTGVSQTPLRLHTLGSGVSASGQSPQSHNTVLQDTNGAFPLHGTVRFGTAQYGTVRYGSVRVGLRFHCSLVPL